MVQPVDAGNSKHVTKGDFLKELLDNMNVDVAPYEGTDEVLGVSEDLAPYIEAGVRLDLVDAQEENSDSFNKNIKREEAYAMLAQSLNLLDDYDEEGLHQFRDYRAVSDEFVDELSAAAALDLVEGFGQTLRPKAPLTADYLEGMFERYDNNIDRISVTAANDFHGRILHNADNGELGMAKVATIANQLREENEYSFLFDIGDTFHGTNYVNFSEGEAAVDLMNEMEFDAMVLGNHDFNFGQERLHELMDMADFPVMSGNVRYEDTDELLTEDGYQIVEAMGKEIALLSITAYDTYEKTAPANLEGLYIEREVEALQGLVDEVKDDVDHIFVLSHSGYNIEVEMAEQVDGVDFIMGGHSHDTLEYPEIHNNTYITQAWEFGKALSVNNVLFHDGEFIGINGHLARDHDGLEPEPNVQAMLDDIEAEVGETLNEVIATIDVDLDGARANVRTKETNLGNLITDAMRDLTGSDIAFTNGGGIRESISAGDVTKGDVITAFPFLNFVIEIEVTGEDLLRSAEHGVRLAPEENGGFFHVSGMSYTYDPSQSAGERIVDMYVGGEEVDPEATYTVATNDFMAGGGDGYTWLGDAEMITDTGELLNEVLIDYLQAGKEIPQVEGRIQRVD